MWLHEPVADDDRPELKTNKEWRQAMKTARGERGLSQRALAELIGLPPTDQGRLSQLERGDIAGSADVMPICRVLDISPPEFYESERTRKWIELGRLYDEKIKSGEDSEQVRLALELLERMVRTPNR